VLDLAEVLRPQPVQRRAVHLGGTADEIVHLRLEELAVGGVVPGVPGYVPAVDEYLFRVPIFLFARQEIAAFEQQNSFAPVSEDVCQSAAARARSDDYDVVVIGHSSDHVRPSVSATASLAGWWT